MKNRHSLILRRAAALLITLTLLVSVLPAAMAASNDWSDLQITVSWYDDAGEMHSVTANPVWEAEGSFWIALPPDAPLDGLTITAYHPNHNYQYDGSLPGSVTDAGQYLDGSSYTTFFVTDPDTGATEEFNLYFSTQTETPMVVPAEPEEDPEEAARRAAEEEAARQAEEQRLAEEAARQAEEQRLAEEAARQAEEQRLAEEAARQAEEQRLAEEAARQAEEQRLAEEAARQAEEQRLAEEAARQAEEQRLAEEAARQAEEQRLAEEAARQAEEQRLAEEAARQAEEQRLAEEAARQAEEQRFAEEAARQAEEQRLAEEATRQAEEQRLAEEAARQAEEQRLAEETARQAEEQRLAEEAARQAEEQRLAEEAARQAEVPTEAPVMPVDEIINRYGVTNAKVNYRKGPGTNTGKYGEIPVGSYVYLIYTQKNDAGEYWTLVDAAGERGYLMSKFINVLTQEDSDAYNLAQPTQARIYTLEDIFPASAAPAETMNEPEQAPENEPEPEPEYEPEQEPANEPEPASEPEQEPANEPEPEPADETRPAYLNEPEPETGDETKPAYLNEPETEKTESSEQNSTPVNTEAPVITEGVMINRYGRTNAGKLGFRAQPDSKSKTNLIARLDKDVPVYLLRADKNDAGESWTYVEVNGTRGYIKTEFLNLLTDEDSAKWDSAQSTPAPVYSEEELFPTEAPTEAQTTPAETQPEETEQTEPTPAPETPTPVPTETPAPEIPVGEMINRYGKTNSKVFFRREASTNSKSQGELKKNTSVYLIYTKENELGETWTYAMVNGKTGYIMTTYLDLLTAEDSAKVDGAKGTPAPVFTLEDIFPTEEPTATVTFEVTDEPSVEPTATPTAEPTATPTEEPTATPTATPTEKPTAEPTATPTEEPTPEPLIITAEPTAKPTAEPTPEPLVISAPTAEPIQRVGYAMTIGDGVPVREWPTANSAIQAELPVNKIVYVTGQVYVNNTAWSVTEYDRQWGYVRADLLRMIPEGEMQAYVDLIKAMDTPAPNVTPVPYVYDGNDLSCYGYVTTDAVNFRAEASSSSRRIRLMKKYALFIVYGTTQVDGETWYRVSWNNQEGYVNGKYFKQMTVREAEEFLASSKYREGLANNSDQSQQSQSSGGNDSPATTGSPSGVVSAEDQKVSEWVNPATGSTVSYEPFDPFATAAPLTENELEKNEFVNSLIGQIESGELKAEDVQKELEKFYKDAKDPEGSVNAALEYIQGKTNLQTEAPTETPTEQVTEEAPEYPQEKSSGGGAGWVIALILLAAAGGGGYYWYIRKQKEREAAQRMAKQKVAKQRREAAGQSSAAKPSDPVSAQNAARIRTGSYTGTGTAKPKATPSTPSGTQSGRTYGAGSKNPYGRYSASDTDEDASYTASFKPNAGKGDTIRNDRKPDDGDSEA